MRMRASFSYSRLHTLTVTLLQPMSLRLKFCNFAFLGPKMSFALREKPSVKKVSKKFFAEKQFAVKTKENNHQ